MKTILLLTDFSENAAHAAETAVLLSAKLRTNLLLFNNSSIVPSVAYPGDTSLIADQLYHLEDERKKKLDELSDRLEPIFHQLKAGERQPTIYCQLGEGDLSSNVKELVDQKEIEFIVMGASTDSSIDHVFFGSDTMSVIRKAISPVLLIPENSDMKKVDKIIFATDFHPGDIDALHFLIKQSKAFESEIEVVHVNVIGDKETKDTEKEDEFKEQINQIKDSKITYRDIRGKDVIKRLTRLCKESKTDLLAMVHQKNSFLASILTQSIAKKALSAQKLPLMIFSSAWKEES